MMMLNTRKTFRSIAVVLAISVVFAACKKDKDSVEEPAQQTKPTITKVEIGSGNNKRGLRGRDFHFNADITAVTKINTVHLSIQQKKGESYTSPRSLDIPWNQYKGVKNTNVHQHFTIPKDLPEGKYDFIFTVTDENGSKAELIETLIVIDPINVPIDPLVTSATISLNGRILFYSDKYVEKEFLFKKNDILRLQTRIGNIKGDGILYSVLIKRKSNYYPESVDNLDFSKVIVVSKVEHKAVSAISSISSLRDGDATFKGESIIVGATNDNNTPTPNAIAGEKEWESGQYNWVILYKNSSFNVHIFKSIPITINYIKQ